MKLTPLLVAGGLLLAGLMLLTRPVCLRTEAGDRLLVLWRGQTGRIRFINSVTGQPVAIGFEIGRLFQNFSAVTDPTTEAYYTHGVYPMDSALAAESTRRLYFCSSTGMELKLGSHDIHVQGGCLEATLIWTH